MKKIFGITYFLIFIMITPAFCLRDINEALVNAARDNDIEKVSELIPRGSDVNSRNFLGKTPLIYAVENGNAAIVKVLISGGANVNDQLSRNGTAPLMCAKTAEIVSLLINAGAIINAKNIDGMTALMLAADNGFTEVVKILVEEGADVNIKSKKGETSLSIAEAKGYKDIVEYLKTRISKE